MWGPVTSLVTDSLCGNSSSELATSPLSDPLALRLSSNLARVRGATYRTGMNHLKAVLLWVTGSVLLTACGATQQASAVEPQATASESDSSQDVQADTSDEPAPEATPPCGRNSTEFCECPSGGSALRVCVEGTWAECPCEGVTDDFADDDFDDE